MLFFTMLESIRSHRRHASYDLRARYVTLFEPFIVPILTAEFHAPVTLLTADFPLGVTGGKADFLCVSGERNNVCLVTLAADEREYRLGRLEQLRAAGTWEEIVRHVRKGLSAVIGVEERMRYYHLLRRLTERRLIFCSDPKKQTLVETMLGAPRWRQSDELFQMLGSMEEEFAPEPGWSVARVVIGPFEETFVESLHGNEHFISLESLRHLPIRTPYEEEWEALAESF